MDFSTADRAMLHAALTHRVSTQGDSPFRDVMATSEGRELTMGIIGARLLVAFLREWERARPSATKEEKVEAALAGTPVTEDAIAALIKRIEREGQT